MTVKATSTSDSINQLSETLKSAQADQNAITALTSQYNGAIAADQAGKNAWNKLQA